MPFLLSDTVGFIRKLPHHLVESFKSTLDEARESDVLVHVVDISHPQHEDHIATVIQTLKDLGVEDKPTLMVFNKIDLYRKKYFDEYLDEENKVEILTELQENYRNTYNTDNVFISAVTKENVADFRKVLQQIVEKEYDIRYPHQRKFW
jgi:GTP-binding protein HflX